MGEDFIFGTTSLTDQVVKKRELQLRGLWHGHRREPQDPLPGRPVRLLLTVGRDLDAQDVWCYYTVDGQPPRGRGGHAATGMVVSLRRVGVHWEDLVWGYVEDWEGEIPAQPEGTLVRYALEADGRYASGGEGSATDTDIFAYSVDSWKAPDWARDAIIYHIFLDRFHPGSGRQLDERAGLSGVMGGTLRGVTENLPYIQSLGFNCLWLSPICASPSSHRYDAVDLFRIAEPLGSESDLHELVDRAHAMGLRVILDFVANHTSNQHPFFCAAQADRESSYCSWYTFDCWPHRYRAFFQVKEVPQINLEHLPARQHVLDAARYWMSEFGVDGYRLDYALGPSHNFWVDFRRTVRAVNPDAFTVAEATASAAELRTYLGAMDGGLDFLWCERARRTFAVSEETVADFDRFLRRHEAFFGEDLILPTFVDNHDMNRFLWLARGDKRRLRLAAACQFTLSQPPIVYYGTEVGLSQRADCRECLDHARLPMLWGSAQDTALADWYKRLCLARRQHPALRRGRRTPLLADATRGLLVYAKTEGADLCLVLLHAGDEDLEVELPLPPGQYHDLLADREYRVDGNEAKLHVEPWMAAILTTSPAGHIPPGARQ